MGTAAIAAWQAAVANPPILAIWPTYVFSTLSVAALYMCFATIWKFWPCGERVVQTSVDAGAPVAALPAAPVDIRLKPEIDTATNLLRLGVLNRGDLGRFRVAVIAARDEDGNPIGSGNWPVPWLEDGSVGSKDVPKFGRPLLDLAGFDFLRLQQDLATTKWGNGKHWVFPSLPQPVTFGYSPVRTWSDLDAQYIVLTLRVIRDEPEGHVDFRFKIGVNGTKPYFRELPEEPEQQNGTEPEPVSTPELTPVVTYRWRHTSDGVKVAALMNLQHNMMSHPGYTGRQWGDEPPSIRIGMLIGCNEIDPSFSGTELREKLAAFLDSPVVRNLIGSLTHVAEDASWANLAGHGLLALEAALTTGDDPMEGTPVASARFIPPTRALLGSSERAAALILYVEPRTADGEVPPASDLAEWYRRFNLGLAVPTAFADFLSKDLGLGTFDPPPAQFGIWLTSPQSLTTMVDTDGLRTLPGSSPSAQSIAWVYADPDGKTASGVARDMMIHMCEYGLHLHNFESELPAASGNATP